MPDPYGAFYAAFLKDHPEELAGVQMVTIEGEPQLMMNTTTLRRFITWALGMGLVTNVDKALGMLEGIPTLDVRVRDTVRTQAAVVPENLLLRERPNA
jgi:hypothetical protein